SPFYDPELAACKASAPCEFPWFGETGSPALDQQAALWVASVSQLSGGAMKIDPIDINFVDLVINSLFTGPYQNPMPVFQLGWAPDYPDPTDYVTPLYLPDSTYTAADTVNEQLSLSQFNNSGCHIWSDYVYWANLAKTSGIPDNCQGAAYSAMTYLESIAAVAPAGPQRVLEYNWVEQIGNALAMYIYWGQANEVLSYASWINGASANTNVTDGGGGDQTWYSITGNGVS
ncbi:MAG TPA: hypothetical protein VFF67_07640, partial [Thermoplasmata archaeon]|nr:hypothetical protein [Thermoplasmata archaeon]